MTPFSGAQKQADFYFQRGNNAYSCNNYEEAIAAYEKALELRPSFYELLYFKGLSLAGLARYEEGIKAFDQCLEAKSNVLEVFRLKGLSRAKRKQCKELIQASNRALEDYKVLYSKGLSLAHLGRYEDAIATFDVVVDAKPKHCEALYHKGISLAELGRYEEEIAAYDSVLEVKPDDHKALFNKGFALSCLFRYEEAITAYDQALKIKPDMHGAWINRGIAAGNILVRSPITHSSLTFRHPTLRERSYAGALASFTIGLEYVQASQNPEGWGLLYHWTGRVHYLHGRFLPNATVFLNKAAKSYEKALTTLNASPTLHLGVLSDAIRTHLGLQNTDTVKKYREQGSAVFLQLVNNAPTSAQKQQLEQKFSGFSQLQVDTLIQEASHVAALKTAEYQKNRTLNWILDNWQEQIISPSWAEMQTLLTLDTAAVYWHLSPDTLTTFLLTAEATEPQIISNQPSTKLDSWLKTWNQQYQTYSSKGKTSEQIRESNAWRTNLASALENLREILEIPKIIAAIGDISTLLLIPHRDLHRLPLHSFFPTEVTTIYLPSLQVGLNLKQQTTKPVPRADLSLLSVADPWSKGTARLESAEVEATLIRQHFRHVDTVPTHQATQQNLITKLEAAPQNTLSKRVFNFSGHAEAKRQPKHSCLYLQGDDRLTAETICALNLKNYELVTLSACETAVTGLQTIESDYVGLVSAFLTAGAANIISTLWVVESESNAWLMVNFYQHYAARDSPALALKKAQTWLRTLTYANLLDWLQQQRNQLGPDDKIHDALTAAIGDIQEKASTIGSHHCPYTDPYYWAAFTVTGYSK